MIHKSCKRLLVKALNKMPGVIRKKRRVIYKNLVVLFTKQDTHTTYIARITYEQLMLQK